MDQEAAESIRLRKWHARAKEATAGRDSNEDSWRITRAIKNMWNRTSQDESSSPDDKASTYATRRDSAIASDPELQPFNRMSSPGAGDCAVLPVTISSGSRSMPGTYPTEAVPETANSSSCQRYCNKTACSTCHVERPELDYATLVPNSAQFVPSPSVGIAVIGKDITSLAAEGNEQVTMIPTWAATSVQPPRPNFEQALSAGSIDTPNGSREPLDTTAVGNASQTELVFDRQRELIDDIERFGFTTLVSTATINGAKSLRTVVVMTSNNLLNTAWDLHRLCMGWKEMFLDSPSLVVLEMAEPWNQLDKEHVARACRNMQRGIETYREWSENMEYTRAVAMTRNLMSGEWWADFDEKLGEVDMLDLDDVTTQVELVAKQYCVMGSNTTLQTACSREEAATIAATPSSPLISRKLQLSSVTQAVKAAQFSTTIVVNGNGSALKNQEDTAPKKPAISRTSLSISSPTPKGALRHERGPKKGMQGLPDFTKFTNASLQGSQIPIMSGNPPTRANLPAHLQPLAAAIQNVRFNPLQTRARTRNNPEASSNSHSLKAVARTSGFSRATSSLSSLHALSRETKHLTAASPEACASERTITCPDPVQKLGATLPRSFMSRVDRGSGAHISDSTRPLSKADDTHTSKLLQPRVGNAEMPRMEESQSKDPPHFMPDFRSTWEKNAVIIDDELAQTEAQHIGRRKSSSLLASRSLFNEANSSAAGPVGSSGIGDDEADEKEEVWSDTQDIPSKYDEHQ